MWYLRILWNLIMNGIKRNSIFYYFVDNVLANCYNDISIICGWHLIYIYNIF
jgi:hypothetical protein